MSSPSTAPRPSVMQLAIKEKAALVRGLHSFFCEGGIFVPTPRDYKLGDDVYVLLTLPDDTSAIRWRAAWRGSLPRAAGNRTQGVASSSPKTKNRGSSRPRSRKCWARPWVGTSHANHLIAWSALCRPALAGRLFCFETACLPIRTATSPSRTAQPAARHSPGHAEEAQVDRALCICTTMEEFDDVHALALAHDNFWSTVGVHPDNEGVTEPIGARPAGPRRAAPRGGDWRNGPGLLRHGRPQGRAQHCRYGVAARALSHPYPRSAGLRPNRW
jgi:type IV pilus assembly protein PilZ